MLHDELINALADLVIQGNLENYKDVNDGCSLSAKDFADFGVCEETVAAYMKDVVAEVLHKVEILQPRLARILFDT
jgi:hypothetical protein